MSTSSFIYRPFQEFDSLFDDSFNNWLNRRRSNDQVVQRSSNDGVVGVLRPKMDIHEDKEANTVIATFELPGLTKEGVDIRVHSGRLTVSGESKVSEHEESGYVVHERKFSRTVRLPWGVTDEQIMVSLEDGVLTVAFSKFTPETMPKKSTVYSNNVQEESVN